MGTVGYVWGDDIAGVIDHAGLAISAIVVVVIVVLLIRAHRRRRADAAEPFPSTTVPCNESERGRQAYGAGGHGDAGHEQ